MKYPKMLRPECVRREIRRAYPGVDRETMDAQAAMNIGRARDMLGRAIRTAERRCATCDLGDVDRYYRAVRVMRAWSLKSWTISRSRPLYACATGGAR